MVSIRCEMVEKDIIEKLGLHCKSIELGEAEISYKLKYSSVAYLSNRFKKVTGLLTLILRK